MTAVKSDPGRREAGTAKGLTSTGRQVLTVVTGLPASGKSTVGELLSRELGLPLIDKDTILEALFDSLGCPDPDVRMRLSRASDEVLFSLAGSLANPVLVNWWRHDTAPTRLLAITSTIVQVYCDCPVEVAAARFEARDRHRGHHDRRRSPAEIEEGIRRAREASPGPLGLRGPLIRVETSGRLDAERVVHQARECMAAQLRSS